MTTGSYHKYAKPKTPHIEEGDVTVSAKMKFKVREFANSEYNKTIIEYSLEERKVYAITIGQMSESS